MCTSQKIAFVIADFLGEYLIHNKKKALTRVSGPRDLEGDHMFDEKKPEVENLVSGSL
jgi:hypothetical protein